MVIFMKVYLKMENMMDWENNFKLMDVNMKVILKMGKRMEWDG